MLDPKFFDDLAKKLCDAVPPGLKQVKGDVEKNFHAILMAAFEHFDLVTREEFDIQTAVLTKTRKKVSALEKRVAALEGGHPKVAK